MKNFPRIDISVVTRHNQRLIFECLESIHENYEGEMDVFIILDSVPEKKSSEIKSRFPGANFIENQNNRFFAEKHNYVIEKSNNKYVLILSDDTKVLDDALGKLVSYMEENPEVGMVSPKLLNKDLSLQESTYSAPDLFKAFLHFFGVRKFIPFNKITYKISFFIYKKGESRFWDHNETCCVDNLRGAFVLVRRSTIEEVGLMDEVTTVYGEETEWQHRFNKKGWKIVFYPKAEVIHYGQQTNKKELSSVKEGEVKGILNFFRKHKPSFQYFLLRMIIVTSSLLKILFFFLTFNKKMILFYLEVINNALHPQKFLKGKRIFY